MILKHSLPTAPKTSGIFGGLKVTKRVIDIGAGIRPCPVFEAEHICIEPHNEYAGILEDAGYKVVHSTWDALDEFERKDTTVLALDVIEHLERSEGEELRDMMEEFDQAVIFTPYGWLEQEETPLDAWGLHGGAWQAHRSAWNPWDFRNWSVRAWGEFEKGDPGAIIAWR